MYLTIVLSPVLTHSTCYIRYRTVHALQRATSARTVRSSTVQHMCGSQSDASPQSELPEPLATSQTVSVSM